MAFYVSVINGNEAALALGPFRRAGDAARHVDAVRRFCGAKVKDGHWYAYGTARHKTAHRPGKLNTAMGYADGWIAEP